MKNFTNNSFSLRNARWEVKLVYTGFLLFVFVGMATIGLLQAKRIGLKPAWIAAYYRGGERGTEMSFPKTFAEMAELTHMHAFMMGVFFLVLAHLFIATSVGQVAKSFFVGLTLFSSLGDMGGVWLIRYVSPAFAYLQIGFWLGEWLGYGVLTLYPLYDMWSSNGERPRGGE